MLIFNGEKLYPHFGSYQDYRIVIRTKLSRDEFLRALIAMERPDAYIRTEKWQVFIDRSPAELFDWLEEKVASHIMNTLQFAVYDYSLCMDTDACTQVMFDVKECLHGILSGSLSSGIREAGEGLKDLIRQNFSEKEWNETRDYLCAVPGSICSYTPPKDRDDGSIWNGIPAPCMPLPYRYILQEIGDLTGRRLYISGILDDPRFAREEYIGRQKERRAASPFPIQSILIDPFFRFAKYEPCFLHYHFLRSYILDCFGIMPSVLEMYDADRKRTASAAGMKYMTDSIIRDFWDAEGYPETELVRYYARLMKSERNRLIALPFSKQEKTRILRGMARVGGRFEEEFAKDLIRVYRFPFKPDAGRLYEIWESQPALWKRILNVNRQELQNDLVRISDCADLRIAPFGCPALLESHMESLAKTNIGDEKLIEAAYLLRASLQGAVSFLVFEENGDVMGVERMVEEGSLITANELRMAINALITGAAGGEMLKKAMVRNAYRGMDEMSA